MKPTLVIEISYDQFSDQRVRQGMSLIGWRPDLRQCSDLQLYQTVAESLAQFGGFS